MRVGANNSLPSGNVEPTTKAPSQRTRLLGLLHSRGSAGATSRELNAAIGFRYGARIFELRELGFEIVTHREGETSFRFVLQENPLASLPAGAGSGPL